MDGRSLLEVISVLKMSREAFHLISSLQDPTAVTAAVYANFFSTHEKHLIVAKLTLLQIYEVSGSQRLISQMKARVYGRIIKMKIFKPQQSGLDWLVILTEELNVFFLRFDQVSGKIVTVASEATKSKMRRRKLISCMDHADMLSLGVWTSPLLGVCVCFQAELGRLRLIIAKDLATDSFVSLDVPIEEYHIIDLEILQGTNQPTFCILYEDAQRRKHFKTYSLDIKKKLLDSTKFFLPKIHRSSSSLVCFRESMIVASLKGLSRLSFDEDRKTTDSAHFDVCAGELCCFGTFTNSHVERLLFSDEFGGLHCLGFDAAGEWIYEFLGKTSVATVILQIDEYHVFIGSCTGDSHILELFVLQSTRESAFKVRFSLPNIGPISSLVPLDGKQRYLGACGRHKEGSLRVINGGTLSYERAFWAMKYAMHNVFTIHAKHVMLSICVSLSGVRVLQGTENGFAPYEGSSEFETYFKSKLVDDVQGLRNKENMFFVVLCENSLSIWRLHLQKIYLCPQETEALSAHLADEKVQCIDICGEIVLIASTRKLIYFEYSELGSIRKKGELAQNGIVNISSLRTKSAQLFVALVSDEASVVAMHLEENKQMKVIDLNFGKDSNLAFSDAMLSQDSRVAHPTEVLLGIHDGFVFLHIVKSNGELDTWKLDDSGTKFLSYSTLNISSISFHIIKLRCDQSYCCWNSGKQENFVQLLKYSRGIFVLSTIMLENDEQICTISSSNLGILSLSRERLSEVYVSDEKGLTVKTYPLHEEPTSLVKATVDGNCFLVVNTRKFEPENESAREIEDFYISEESFVKVFCLKNFKLLETYPLEEAERAFALNVFNYHNLASSRVYVCVGTSYEALEDLESKQGRIICYRLLPTGDLEECFSKRVDGATLSLTENFNPLPNGKEKEYFAAGINGDVVLFKMRLGEGYNKGDPESSLLQISRYRKNGFINDLRYVSSLNQILVGDLQSSISVLEVVPGEDGTLLLKERHRDYSQRMIYCVESTSNRCIIAIDNDCCLSSFTVNEEQDIESSERHILQKNGMINMGLQIINFFPLGDYLEKEFPKTFSFGEIGDFLVSPELGYFSISGGVGILYSINEELFLLLRKIERILANLQLSLGGVAHSDWISIYSCGQVFESQKVIDGDLLSMILDLDSESLNAVVTEINRYLSVDSQGRPSAKRKRNFDVNLGSVTKSSLVHFIDDLLLKL